MFPMNTKILAIDDMLSSRNQIVKCLKELGFTDITLACDGAEALKLVESSATPFQLILSDWQMPNLSGLDLLKKLKSDSKHKAIPFIMVTAEGQTQQVMTALGIGAANYVMKPYTLEFLKEKLQRTWEVLSKSDSSKAA